MLCQIGLKSGNMRTRKKSSTYRFHGVTTLSSPCTTREASAALKHACIIWLIKMTNKLSEIQFCRNIE